MRPLPVLLLALCLGSTARAQTAYWQQKVDTKLDVQLDDRRHFLHGFETLTYTNHSPDTLRYLYFHLWPNAYKHDRTAFTEQQLRNGNTDFYYSKPAERGYIDSLQFTIDGESVDYFSYDNLPDIARLDLVKPIVPGQTVTINTPFRVKIPKVFSRLGHTAQAYCISQWFPKPAVYDRKGWHAMPYLDQGEFYAEIGSYEVSITLPENYVVMATGNCLDESENAWMDSLSRIPAPEVRPGTAKGKSPDSLMKQFATPPSAPGMKTLHFKEDNIHDFAWFADKRFMLRKDTVLVPGTDQVVTAWAAFLPGEPRSSWPQQATRDIRDAIRYYSRWIGPYPYRTAKAVEGDMKAGGGMEYPTVTVIDRGTRGSDLRTVIIHEVGHNWFQGMLATNERDHAWMDEGLNSLYEQKTVDAVTRDSLHRPVNRISEDITATVYHEFANTGEDQAINQTSERFRELNYGIDVYYKTALFTRWLEAWMGPEQFEAAMHEYFDTWKHRHPYPEDFEAIIRKHTDQNPDWYFKQGLNGTDRVDFRIRNVRRDGDSLLVSLKNKSGFEAPALVRVYNKDTFFTAATQPFTGTQSVRIATPADWRIAAIAPEVPDNSSHNNAYWRNGLFHRFKVQLKPGGGINRGYHKKSYWLPAIGYNYYDGFMAGLLLHNTFAIPENRFRFILAPMYGFNSETFNGAASLGYAWHPKGFIKEVLLQTDVKSFHHLKTELNVPDALYARYLKVAPGLHFTFKERNPVSTVTRTLSLKAYWIQEDGFDFTLDPSDSLYKPSLAQQEKTYGVLRYRHNNERAVNPFSYDIEGQLGEDFAKINVEAKLRIDYNTKGKSLYIRGFAGKFFTLDNAPFAADRYFLNSTFNGANDYLYDDTYLARNEREGLGSRQISIREGGMKLATPFYANPLGRSDNWLASVNLSTDLPLKKLPLRLFLDAATFADAADLNPSGNKVLYMGGIELHLPFDILSVYFPIVMSSDYRDYLKSVHGNKVFENSITFRLQLHNINWLKAPLRVIKNLR